MSFSIVVPTYNRKDKVMECIESLERLDYPKRKFEVIIMDDGSADGTFHLLRKRKSKIVLRVFHSQHRGPAAARNIGIRKSRFEIVAFTDDDCTVPKNWLKRLAEVYRKHGEIAGAGGYTFKPRNNFLTRFENYVESYNYKFPKNVAIGGYEMPCGATNNMSYKKRVLEEAGMFDEKFIGSQDPDLKLRINNMGYKVAFVPLVVVHDNYNTYGFKNYFQRLVRRKVGDFFFARKHADSIRAMRMEKKNYRVKKNYGILLKMLSEGRIDFFCFLIFISFLGILVNFYIRIGFMMNPV